MSKTPLLDLVGEPEALRRLDRASLRSLADQLRQETVDAVAETGGHLGAGLGVVELSVALHYVFDTPRDKIIWDVGHQAYPHKILTGRRDRIRTLRQGGGLSGFTSRKESDYDPFGAAHSSTSISAGLGYAVGAALLGERYEVIAVIGDGAMSAGMAYEAINNVAVTNERLIVVLNDNAMSIAPPVGSLSRHLDRIGGREPRRNNGPDAEPSLFSLLGFDYVGPVDGHDLDALVPVLESVRDRDRKRPVLVHVLTDKGKGYDPAEQSADRYHGVVKFDVATGKQSKPAPKAPSYTNVFAEALIKEAEADPRIVAVTAAMPSGTGLDKFAKRFPDRCFDVGIAEQHAVTYCGGLACAGLKPFAAIYSTFLQRAFDQVVHDIAIQSLPVRFAIDRAGMVGADGVTHQGSYDIAYLGCLPGFVLMAAADEAELTHMVATAAAIDDRPSALRFPRGEGVGIDLPERGRALEIGRGRIVEEGERIAILSYGARLAEAREAARQLSLLGYGTTVADARFAKPLDSDLIEQLVRHHELLLTLEEGAIGGFASQVMGHMAKNGLLDNGTKFRPMYLPDRFIDHGKAEDQYKQAGLAAEHIVETALAALRSNVDAGMLARA